MRVSAAAVVVLISAGPIAGIVSLLKNSNAGGINTNSSNNSSFFDKISGFTRALRSHVKDGGTARSARKLANGGCYETYSDGKAYTRGDLVSATVIVTSNPAYNLDPDTGLWEAETTSTTTKHNYKCISDYFCGSSGYGPGTPGEAAAWEKQTLACLDIPGTATPTLEPIIPLWSEVTGRCPKAYEGGIGYDGGDVVSVDELVFQCAQWPLNLFCGMTGFRPKQDSFWDYAWNMIGSCLGTPAQAQASIPSFLESLQALGDCSGVSGFGTGSSWTWGNHVTYEAGDVVVVQYQRFNLVFRCRPWPLSNHCSQQGYEPSTVDSAWKMAWDLTGYCTPTQATNNLIDDAVEMAQIDFPLILTNPLTWGMSSPSLSSGHVFRNLQVSVMCQGNSNCGLGDEAIIEGTVEATNYFDNSEVLLQVCSLGICPDIAEDYNGNLCSDWLVPTGTQGCGEPGPYDVSYIKYIPFELSGMILQAVTLKIKLSGEESS